MHTTEDYIKNPDCFVPVWQGQWTPPPELFRFEEKALGLERRGGRLLSFAHRADENRYYPENSLEAVLSCIAMGADVLELDLRITADDIPVMFHDNSLSRCTDVDAVRLRQPGHFPESDRIRDWQYAEIAQLYLLDGAKRPSPHRPARFEDVLRVCSGRIMMILDKLEETAAECGLSEPLFWERHLFPLMARYDSRPSCVKGWHYAMEHSEIWGEYSPALREEWTDKMKAAGRHGRSVEGSTLNRENDRREVWAEMDRIGVDYIMTNDALGLVRYIAEGLSGKRSIR